MNDSLHRRPPFHLLDGMRCLTCLCTLVFLPLLVWAQSSGTQAFAYDRSVSLSIKMRGSEQRGVAVVLDLEYSSMDEGVKAYVVRPAEGKGPFAGILYVHWLGDHETSNRTQFLGEALELAGRGVISVLIDAPWSNPDWYKDRIPENDYLRSVKQVLSQRRAMDLLLSQPGLDPQRVAVVAHDFGAMYSMLAEACDKRAKAYVFMAPTPHFIDWFLFARQPQNLASYKAQISAIDPVLFVSKLSPAPILFQFASRDAYVSAEKAAEYVAAVSEPKWVRTYDVEHHLRHPQAKADRLEWLIHELGL